MEKEAKFDLNEELKKCRTIADLTGKDGLFKKLLKQMIEGALEGEMESHLGYIKSSPQGHAPEDMLEDMPPLDDKKFKGKLYIEGVKEIKINRKPFTGI